MTAAGDLLRATATALPATDPVGAMVAAAWAYDTATRELVDRLVLGLVRATGQTEEVVRLTYGIPACPSSRLTADKERS